LLKRPNDIPSFSKATLSTSRSPAARCDGRTRTARARSTIVPMDCRQGILTLPDGRDLAYAEYGPADGTPIVFFAGFGHDRFGCFPSVGSIRIIAVDRPGIGASSRQPGRTILHFAEDIEYLLDRLRIDRAALLSWSAGGPYALAACARMRSRVKSATLISTIAPPAIGISLAGTDPVIHAMLRLASLSPALIAMQLATLRLGAQHRSDLLLRSLSLTAPRCDRDILARPEVRKMFTHTFRTASATGVAGLIDELTLLARPWTVDLKHIQGANIELIYGDHDRLTPAIIGVRLSQLLSGSRLTVVPGAGHQWIWANWSGLLATIRGQIDPGLRAACR